MRKTQAESTLIARSLRSRQLVCNGLAWESQQIGSPNHAQLMRNEAAECMRLAAAFEVEAHAAHAAQSVDAAHAAQNSGEKRKKK